MKITLLIGMILLSFQALGAEADHYTYRFDALSDISETINQNSNDALKMVTKKINRLGSCDDKKIEKELYNELKKQFGNHSNGKIVKDLLHTEIAEKRLILLKDSIFEEWGLTNGIILGRSSAATSPLALAPTIRIGEQLIGIDKLEHMFGMGFIYFQRHYIKGHKLKRTLKNGVFREKTILGGNIIATGVFAYGDLAANFNGMRFWNHILQKGDDVLGTEYNVGPYIKCENSKFVVNLERPIDFKNYIDASMDESINCSKFSTKSNVRKYKRALEKRGFTCPMSQQILDGMFEKYNVTIQTDKEKRPISYWILNNDGIEDVSYFNEF